MNVIKSMQWTGNLVCALTLALSAMLHADPVLVPAGTSEIPGIALGAGSAGLTGTVLATQEDNFAESGQSLFTGTLRSMVVSTGTGYDFYYQLLNTTPGATQIGNDIFRIAVFGFDSATSDPVYATFCTDGFAGLDFSSVGGVPVGWSSTQLTDKGANGAIYSADRDPAIASQAGVGFDFDPSQFLSGAQNIDSGERSNWFVIRTAANSYTQSSTQISGFGTATALAFAAVPEPATATLILGFGIIPAFELLRKQRRSK